MIKYPDSDCFATDDGGVVAWWMLGAGLGAGVLVILTLFVVWEYLAR